MASPIDSISAAEQAIETLEQAASRSFRPVRRRLLPTIAWYAADPVGIRLLFASLAADPAVLLAATADIEGIQPVPVTIVRGTALSVACRFDGQPGAGPLAALETFGIDSKTAAKATIDNMLILAADLKKPLALSDPDRALELALRLLAGDKQDTSSLTSITLTLPQHRLADVVILVHQTGTPAPVESVWAVIPGHGLDKQATAALASHLTQSEQTLLVPFIRITTADLTEAAEPDGTAPSLQALIESRAPSTGLHNGPRCPVLPLGDDLFGTDTRADSGYLRHLFDTVWDCTVAYARPRAIARRQDRLAAHLMEPPGSIMRLMRAHALLPQLRDLAPPAVATPTEHAFRNIAATGTACYQGRWTVLLKQAADASAKKAAKPISGTEPAAVPPEAVKTPEPSAEIEAVPEEAPVEPVEPAAPEPEPETVPEPAADVAPEKEEPKEPAPEPEPVSEPEPEPEPEPDAQLLALSRFVVETAANDLFQARRDNLDNLALEIEELAMQGPGDIPVSARELLNGLPVEAGALLRDHETRISDAEKELAALTKPKRKAVSPETLEPLEQAEMFWRDFVPASLKKISIRKYDDDVKSIVTEARTSFNDYLGLTPDIEEGFVECKKQEWPRLAKETTQKMNTLFDDILDLWKLSVGQQFSTLEDFRGERFPDEPPFGTDVTVKTGRRPALKGVLNAPIPKKPGIITKILTMKAESSAWRDSLIKTFSEEAGGLFDQYRKDAVAWLKNAYNNVGSLLNERVATAKQHADAVHRRIEALSSPEKPDPKQVAALKQTIAQEREALDAGHTSLAAFEQAWKTMQTELGMNR